MKQRFYQFIYNLKVSLLTGYATGPIVGMLFNKFAQGSLPKEILDLFLWTSPVMLCVLGLWLVCVLILFFSKVQIKSLFPKLQAMDEETKAEFDLLRKQTNWFTFIAALIAAGAPFTVLFWIFGWLGIPVFTNLVAELYQFDFRMNVELILLAVVASYFTLFFVGLGVLSKVYKSQNNT